MTQPEIAGVEPVGDRRALERQLVKAIGCVSLYLLVVGAASIVVVLVLLESTRTDDLTRVATISLVGGALGATVRGLYELMLRFEEGRWELSDGTTVERRIRRVSQARRSFLRDRHLPDQPAADSGPRIDDDTGPWREVPGLALRRDEEAAEARRAADEAERQALGLSPAEYELLKRTEEAVARGEWFGLLDLPLLILLPLLGAALGLVAFAGLVGGFLIASGSNSPSYSPAGLLFVAVLAGMFAPNFIASLARAADAIFGTTRSGPPRR